MSRMSGDNEWDQARSTKMSKTADAANKLCMACSKWVPQDMKSCHCGHVFKQLKSINGKRFTEGRFYQEAEDTFYEPKKKLRATTSIFYREKVTYMPGYSYDEMEEETDKREKKRKRKRQLHLFNAAVSNPKTMNIMKSRGINIPSRGFNMPAKDAEMISDEQPLIQVLQEINNKITNQRRLWINLDS
eukprot:Seg1896.4 transcript_id=Seg1896.4/GoldUCD/mRNA.D3Y31 product="hypothetical protein" protein_id=Seg1896.4/GoldUCD/D3Y31